MVSTLQFEDRLEGALNFNSWKAMVLNLLEENDLDDKMTRYVANPTDDNGKAPYKKNQAKAKIILFDSVKDYLIHIISPLNIAKECYDDLIKLFEAKNPSWKRALKGKIRSNKITRNDTITTFFTKISHVRSLYYSCNPYIVIACPI